jgi:hypothetical protein
MMTEVRLSDLKPDAQRIADRLKPSNDMSTANVHAVHGTGPTRTHTTVHRGGHQAQSHGHGKPAPAGEDILGGKR